jgi:surface protein
MFENIEKSFKPLNIENFDTSKITNLQNMFTNSITFSGENCLFKFRSLKERGLVLIKRPEEIEPDVCGCGHVWNDEVFILKKAIKSHHVIIEGDEDEK